MKLKELLVDDKELNRIGNEIDKQIEKYLKVAKNYVNNKDKSSIKYYETIKDKWNQLQNAIIDFENN